MQVPPLLPPPPPSATHLRPTSSTDPKGSMARCIAPGGMAAKEAAAQLQLEQLLQLRGKDVCGLSVEGSRPQSPWPFQVRCHMAHRGWPKTLHVFVLHGVEMVDTVGVGER